VVVVKADGASSDYDGNYEDNSSYKGLWWNDDEVLVVL
jgi:hypothetical protein